MALALGIGATCEVYWQVHRQTLPTAANKSIQLESKPVTTIITDIDAFVAAQNQNRGNSVAGGGTVPLDYNALTGAVAGGSNAVTGVAGIMSGATPITLPASQIGNAVIVDGGISTIASTSGPHGYSLFIDTTGIETLTDNNTGNSQTITGASYFLFNGGATNSDGSFQGLQIVTSGTTAEVAEMYNAALGRQPDLAGLEFYAIPTLNRALTLHQDAGFFENSPEFRKDYPDLLTPADSGGPNDQAFITELYGNILHRTPSADEISFYVNYMQGTLSGQTAPGNRADLLIYFAVSPENQKDVAGWLTNPTNGPVSLGAMTTANATAILASEASSGTINAADFTGMSSNSSVDVQVNGNSVNITGGDYYGAQGTDAGFYTAAPNIKLILSTQYYSAYIAAANTTVSGVSSGGSVITINNTPSIVIPIHTTPAAAGSGTVNLFSNDNWIEVYGTTAVATTTVVNGWNSTDVFSGTFSSIPSSVSTFSSLVAQPDGTVYQGNISSLLSGAAIGAPNQGTWFTNHQLAINVGTLANDSVSTMVTAANRVYTVGDIGNVKNGSSETAFFFGQDSQGNTMVFFWQGDSTHAGTVLAADITGAIELVGVQASSLTSANFHH